jgi:hypothetical protein
MMNLKESIEAMRLALRSFTTQQKFADYKLADGTTIRINGDLVNGAEVFVVTDTEVLPAPDGEHTIEGVGVVKTLNGRISEIVATQEPIVEEQMEITPEIASDVTEEIAGGYPELTPDVVEEIVKKHLVAIMEELKLAYAEMGTMKEKMSLFATQINSMVDIVETIGNEPSKPNTITTNAIIENKKTIQEHNFSQVAETLKKLKNK